MWCELHVLNGGGAQTEKITTPSSHPPLSFQTLGLEGRYYSRGCSDLIEKTRFKSCLFNEATCCFPFLFCFAMAKGEGAEQYSNVSLLNKSVSSDSVKLSRKHEHRNRLSICNKICYAIGGAPYQITGSALGFFLQLYLLDVAQLDPFYASIILFVGRAWDAVTDPTVGFLISRSPWTRFGRMMPWYALFFFPNNTDPAKTF
ncbi:hypothetical protein ILYODFUR_029497 [Ilyodon furcidens]|uniref:Uncharacterized protein n=1 Tax=Ilyodon furcidens TaxID=33524 RepID=A0ABV0TYR7_9TELE